MLFDALTDPSDAIAVRVGDDALNYRELRDAATAVADRVAGAERVAVWADIAAETVVGVVGALLAGVPAVPLNPKAGERELEHILADSAPDARPRGAELPTLPRRAAASTSTSTRRGEPRRPAEPDGEAPALVVYTSGTTGPAEGRRSCRAGRSPRTSTRSPTRGSGPATTCVVHALPLFHVHGLVLGDARAAAPRRRRRATSAASRPRRSRRRSSDDATMLFGVPTMYHRLGRGRRGRPGVARGARAARGCSSPARPRSRPPSTSASSG